MLTKTIFTNIANNNLWGHSETVSGPGSTIKATTKIQAAIPKLIAKYGINSILDLPCGDFNWMSRVKLPLTYVGGDIVESIIQANKANHPETNFQVLDILTDPLPKVDLILCRDCLVHLTFEQINTAITNIKNSGTKYLLTTHFPDVRSNNNIKTGEWRPINFTRLPFKWSDPVCSIAENYYGKTLSMWEVNNIRD